MNTLVRLDDAYPETFWGSVTVWLDEVFSACHTSHRLLDSIDDALDSLERELTDLDVALYRDLTPAEEVASHRLSLRYRDLQDVMYAKWTSAPIRRSTLRALRGIHESYLGPITEARHTEVLFEVSRFFVNRDLDSYVTAHRVENDQRRVHGRDGERRLTLAVVDGPLWVHDVYRHLLGESHNGRRLRSRYVRGTSGRGYGERPSAHLLGAAVTRPTDDVIDAALRLWTPEEENSPYHRFAAAVDAARLL